MALEDIFEKIKRKTEEELKKIELDKCAKFEEIEKKYQKIKKIKHQEIITRANKVADDKIETTKINLSLGIKNSNLAKKQEIIDRVYQVSLEELVKNKEKSFDLILKLLKKCPEKGIIFYPKERQGMIIRAVKKIGRNYSFSEKLFPISSGFIFSNETIEVNNSFENLIKIFQSNTEIEVAKILFKN